MDEELADKGYLAFSGSSRRIGSAEDESVGLTPAERDAAREAFRLGRADKKLPSTVNPSIYRRVPGRRPLLILRLVEPKLGGTLLAPVLVWGLSFPSSAIAGGTVDYIVTTQRMRELFGEPEVEEEARGDAE